MRLTRRWRIGVQAFSLLGFLWLFLQTEYRGADELAYPVSLLFRLDPLALLAAFFSPGETDYLSFWPAFLLLALTLLLGRFFCGWFCPLGTLFDFCGNVLRKKNLHFAGWPRFKFYLLATLAIASLFGLQLLGVFDPLSIFLRSFTLALNPVFNLLSNDLFDWLYRADIPLISPAADAVYPFFRDYLLAFRQPVFLLSLFTAGCLILLVALERLQPRFWCRNICPLGALLGLCSKYSLLQRTPHNRCSGCRSCATHCRMDSVAEKTNHGAECIRCLDCLDFCQPQRTEFKFSFRSKTPQFNLSRRVLIGSATTGALLAPLAQVAPAATLYRDDLVRPPGAVEEEEFLRRCIRCGECMKVCIGGALHPDLLRGGVFSLWSPVLVARLGYCEYNCTLCGQVCPTGAIKLLPVEEKRKVRIGLAVIDKNRCLPFARGEECLVCEEHCPTGKKAIVFDERSVLVGSEPRNLLQPRVEKELCIGCGICETRCPVSGTSAIRIVSEGESRKPGVFL